MASGLYSRAICRSPQPPGTTRQARHLVDEPRGLGRLQLHLDAAEARGAAHEAEVGEAQPRAVDGRQGTAGGVEKILQVELSAEETAMLKTSADSVQKVVDIVKAKS